jgi:hypothetical protein
MAVTTHTRSSRLMSRTIALAFCARCNKRRLSSCPAMIPAALAELRASVAAGLELR